MQYAHLVRTSTIVGGIVLGTFITHSASQDARSQSDNEAAARTEIRNAVLNYPQAWYAGDAHRMTSCLHPALRKCISVQDPATGEWSLHEMTAQELIDATAHGWGTHTPEDVRRADVEVLDIYGDVASVKISMHDWIDYLHVARINGEWKIINVLWERTPEAKARRSGG